MSEQLPTTEALLNALAGFYDSISDYCLADYDTNDGMDPNRVFETMHLHNLWRNTAWLCREWAKTPETVLRRLENRTLWNQDHAKALYQHQALHAPHHPQASKGPHACRPTNNL